MSRHLERLLHIDTLLRSEYRPTTGKLAQVLEVSDRSHSRNFRIARWNRS
ncbi:hypothetical protein [Microseira wollei]|nr:hypothetical protein [Microseira wollei]